MNIYLVKIREDENSQPYVEYKSAATTKDKFTAISHVWGDPSTIQRAKVTGIPWEVELSPGKKDILQILKQTHICGSEWFWMDLFCIDQSKDAKIPIAEQLAAIPTIYKSAQRVRVLLEHPICRLWRNQVRGMAPDMEIRDFRYWEIHHGRRCKCMPYLDPWFVRLWTRQEGLYAKRLEMIPLQEVDCPRLTDRQQTAGEKWREEGIGTVRREIVDVFVMDKMRYHGILPSSGVERIAFQFYLDMIYRGSVDFTEYPGSCNGPSKEYSPIESAWRSGRETTKLQDYILAVLPDIQGYKVPEKAPRKIPFTELLADAFQQLNLLSNNTTVAIKINSGLVGKPFDSTNSAAPLFPTTPKNITEAFDSFLFIPISLKGPVTSSALAPSASSMVQVGSQYLYTVLAKVALEPASLSTVGLPNLITAWESTAAIVDLMVNAPLSSPCTGSSRILSTEQDLLYRYFAGRFSAPAISQFVSPARFEKLVPHGIVNLDEITNLNDETYEKYLRRFLICLICSVSLDTANEIAGQVEFCYIPYGGANLLAIVNKSVLSADVKEFVLLQGSTPAIEGFYIGFKKYANAVAVCIVGRTWVYKSLSRIANDSVS